MKRLFRLSTAVWFVLLLAILLLFVYPTLRRGWYDLTTLKHRQYIEFWMTHPAASINPEAWESARIDLSAASEACPEVAQFKIDLAQLSYTQAMRVWAIPVLRDAYLRNALPEVRKAMQQRVVAGNIAAMLVQIKAYTGVVDEEFARALDRALRNSPNDPSVIASLLDSLWQTYPLLKPAQRKILNELRERMLMIDPVRLGQIAASHPTY
ncbi:hypothetical protein KSF73_12895 [Burkholderiaceae bacterium DAT-1]|nr:hypothetical protein [Burkholderiaceae bacterium DAT-1]